MALRIYDTLTRQVQTLKPPSEAGVLGIYACGPTVYDDPHIGHLRSAYVFDVARKVLRHAGYKTKFVRNVTDVDDKIIDRAAKDKTPAKQLAVKYLAAYHAALAKFGIEPPDVEPKATEHIAHMHGMIRELISREIAYEAAGSVYFRVRKFADYGALSNRRNLDELFQNTRKDPGEGKEDPFDFALWKKADDELSVDSPWGRGRPGWHIECSAMSSAHLGDAFEIHGGGLDLLFPHHENERAQSMALAKPFARVWMHHGLVTVGGKKMSKSDNNFVTLEEVEKRGYSLDALKLLFLQSHYRSDVDFTREKLKALDETLKSFRLFFEKASGGAAGNTKEQDESFRAALDNDFDTPAVVALLFGELTRGNQNLQKGDANAASVSARWIKEKASLFGLLGGAAAEKTASWHATLKSIVRLREDSRQAKKFQVSDLIRGELVKIGFEAEDGKRGSFFTYLGKETEADVDGRLKDLLKRVESMK